MSASKAGSGLIKSYRKMSLDDSMRIRELHQKKNVKGKDLVCMFPQYSMRSVYRHMSTPLTDTRQDQRQYNHGVRKVSSDTHNKINCRKGRKKHQKIPAVLSVHIRYLHQYMNMTGKQLVRRYRHYSKASLYKHMVKPIGEIQFTVTRV